MLKIFIKSIITIILTIIVSVNCYAQAPNKDKAQASVQSEVVNIRIVSSYPNSNGWSQKLAKNIKNRLEEKSKKLITSISYTNLYKVKNIKEAQLQINDATFVMNNLKTIVITIGYEAWMALKNSNTKIIQNNYPIVVCGIEEEIYSNYPDFIKNKTIKDYSMESINNSLAGFNATAVVMPNCTKETLEVIKKIFPDIQHLVYFSDESYNDISSINKLEEITTKNLAGVMVSTVNTDAVTGKYINDFAAIYSKNNVTSYSGFLIANYNLSYSCNPDNFPKKNMKIPLFVMNNVQPEIEDNIVAACTYDLQAYADKIVATVSKILSGREAWEIPVQNFNLKKELIYKVCADKHGFNTRHFSKDEMVILPKESKREVNIILITSIFLSILLILLILSIDKIYEKSQLIRREIKNKKSVYTKKNILYKCSPFGIAIFYENGTIKEANPEFHKMLRAIISDYKGNESFNLFDSGLVSANIIGQIDKGQSSERNVIIESDNTKMNNRILFHPIVIDNERYITVIIADTTQTVKERLATDNTNTIFSKAITESKIGVAELDLINGSCTATDGWYNGLGASKGANIERCLNNVIKEDRDKFYKFAENAVCSNATKFSEDMRVMNSDSSYHWIKMMAIIKECNPEEKQITCSAIIMDIDAQKQCEEQLRDAYINIIKSIRTKNSFVSNMSHEIRTPLNSIIGFSELIIESSDAAEQKELITYLDDNSQKLLNLITELVDISKIESGAITCNMSDINLNSMLKELYDQTLEGVKGKNVAVRLIQDGSCIIYSDAERIKKVMNIFLSNAINNTQSGSIEFGFRVKTQKVTLFVNDTGCGIDDQKKELLFNRFSKVNKEYVGFGLGLPIANSIVKLLKGEIGFESTVGKGSSFWFTVPCDYIGFEQQVNVADKIDNASSQIVYGQTKTILIAEDNQNNFQLLNFMLKNKYRIIHAINGEKAVEFFKERNPDIILMDIKMPVMDGYQATAEIRKISADIPIIAVTAFAFDRDKEKILESSFSGFIPKPVNEKELLEVINKFLDK